MRVPALSILQGKAELRQRLLHESRLLLEELEEATLVRDESDPQTGPPTPSG
jgi:hypothetical protein